MDGHLTGILVRGNFCCTASKAGHECTLNLAWPVQVYGQLGDDSPDVDVSSLKAMYKITQRLIAEDRVSAGHDISDGGIAVTLLEAAFAGNCGIQVRRLCTAAAIRQWMRANIFVC